MAKKITAHKARKAMKRGDTVYYILNGEKRYASQDTELTDAIIEKSYWFREKKRNIAVDNIKRVCYSVYSLVKTLKNIFGGKAK